MNEETQAAIRTTMLDEIVTYTIPQPLAPHEFTVYDLMDRAQETTGERLSRNRAARLLREMRDDGLLGKRRVYHNERWHVAFWLTEKGKEKLGGG